MSEEEQQIKKKNHFKSALKWLGIGIGSLFLILLLMLVSVHFILRSGTLTQTAVSKINPITEAFGVKISQLTSAEIDVFGLIDIRGLVLDWQDDESGNAHIVAEHFKLDYSFRDLLSKQLNVKEMRLEGINLTAEVNAQATEIQEPEASEPLDLNGLADLISQPPLPISVDTIELKDIVLDLTVVEGSNSQSLQGSLENVSSNLLWNSEQLKLNTALMLNQTGTQAWKLLLLEPNKTTEIDFLPRWHTNVSLDLRNSKQQWRLPELSVDQITSIENLVIVETQNNAAHTLLDAQVIKFNLQTHKEQTNENSSSSTGLEGLFPLPLTTKLTTRLDAVGLDFNDDQGTRLKTSLNQILELTINNTINSLQPFTTDATYSLNSQLSLPHVAFGAESKTINTSDIAIQLATAGAASVNTQQDVELKAKSAFDFNSSQVTVTQQASKANPQAIQASFTPQINLKADADIPSINDVMHSHLVVKPEITVQNIRAEIKENDRVDTYRIRQKQLLANIELQDKKLALDAAVELQQVKAPQLKKVITVNNDLDLSTDLEGKNTSLTLSLALNKDQILAAKINAENQNALLATKHEITLNLPLWLTQLHEAAEALKLLGHSHISLTGTSQINHSAENIQTANTDLVDQWPIVTQGKVNFKQIEKPRVKEGVFIKDTLFIDYNIDKNKLIKTDLNIQSAGIQVEPLLAPVPIEINNQAQLTWPLSTTKTKGFVNIEQETALRFDLSMIDKPKNFLLQGEIFASESPVWQKYLAELKETEAVGQLYVTLKPHLTVKHQEKTALNVDPENLDALAVDLTLDAVISQSNDLRGDQLILAKPLTLSQKLKWSSNAVDSLTAFSFGALELPDQLVVRSLPGKIMLKADNGLAPTKAEVTLRLEPANILLTTESDEEIQTLTLDNVLTPLDLSLSVEQQDTLAIINELLLDVGQGLLTLEASGNGALDGKAAQLDITLASSLKDKLLPETGLTGSGSFALPLEVSFINAEQLTLNGVLKFEDFNVAMGEQKIQNLNGSIKIDEELILRDEYVGFKYILQADPFQRVDFSRIQPYLDIENVLSFSNIQMGDLQLGPGMTSLTVNQNLINMQRLDLEIFKGSVMGQVFFDAQPGGQKFGLLSRLSRIDARELLPETSSEKQSEYAPLSARTAVTFDVTERLMEGEIDVTEINKAQLLQLLELVDPEHKDEQIATVRSAVRFAHPEWIKVDMKSGLMNLDVAISALPKPISIRGLPLTPLIQQYASDIEEALVQLPLRKM